MSETKWTPGPWRAGLSADNGIPCVDARDLCGRLFEVCEVWGQDDDKTETEMSRANAHLIAAAPDGYAFAEAVESMIVDGGLADDAAWGPILIQCREFMGKARGEP